MTSSGQYYYIYIINKPSIVLQKHETMLLCTSVVCSTPTLCIKQCTNCNSKYMYVRSVTWCPYFTSVLQWPIILPRHIIFNPFFLHWVQEVPYFFHELDLKHGYSLNNFQWKVFVADFEKYQQNYDKFQYFAKIGSFITSKVVDLPSYISTYISNAR